jgi:hypothetical protein
VFFAFCSFCCPAAPGFEFSGGGCDRWTGGCEFDGLCGLGDVACSMRAAAASCDEYERCDQESSPNATTLLCFRVSRAFRPALVAVSLPVLCPLHSYSAHSHSTPTVVDAITRHDGIIRHDRSALLRGFAKTIAGTRSLVGLEEPAPPRTSHMGIVKLGEPFEQERFVNTTVGNLSTYQQRDCHNAADQQRRRLTDCVAHGHAHEDDGEPYATTDAVVTL